MFLVSRRRSLLFIKVIGLLLILGLLLSGCENGDIGSGDDDVINSTVSNLQEMEAALNSSEIPMVDLASDFSGTGSVTVNNRSTDLILDLSGRTDVAVNLSISQPANTNAWTFTLTNGTLSGDFTIDDPAVTVNNDAAVTGTTTINNVAAECFNNRESGSLNDTNIADVDGGSLFNLGIIQGNIQVSGSTGPATGEESPFLFSGGFQLPENNAFHVTNNAWIRFQNRQETQTTLGSTPINVDGGNQNHIEVGHTDLVQQVQTALNAGSSLDTPPVRIVSLAAPTFSPSPGVDPFVVVQHVEITGPAGATVYYTTDNTLPTEFSAEYTGTPIEVDSTMTLRARAYLDNAVSEVTTAHYVVELDLTPPDVTSILRTGENLTNSSTVEYTVTFSESVTGVDSEDFNLTVTDGSITGAAITAVDGSDSSYTVTVNTGSGSGTLRLDLTDDDSIVDIASNPLGGTGVGNGSFNSGEEYTLDKTAPAVDSILRVGNTPTNSSTVDYTVTFSESVTGVGIDDFTPAVTGSISGEAVTAVDGIGTSYTVTVSTGSGDGTLRLDLLDNGSIFDTAGNPLGGPDTGSGDYTSGEEYTVENTPPVVTSITRAGFNPSNAVSIDFTVAFSKDVTGVGTDDFRLSTTGDIAGADVTAVDGTGKNYTVTVDRGTGDGTIRLDLLDDDSIFDAAGNPLGGPETGNGDYSSGEEYIVETTAPFVITIARVDSNPTNAASVVYNVTFSENVTGVGIDDFTPIVTSGAITDAAVSAVNGSDANYTVTVNTGTGEGTLRLDLTDDDSIKDETGNFLGGAEPGNGNFTGGEEYTIDRTGPTVSSIIQIDNSPTNAASVAYTVTFSEVVSGVNAEDFTPTVISGMISGQSVIGVDGSGSSYTVTVDTGAGSGSIRLDLLDDDSISDEAGNHLGGTDTGNGDFTTAMAYVVDKTAPYVTEISMLNTSPTDAASVDYNVIFSEGVDDVDSIDFTLVTTGGITGASISQVNGSRASYTVTVATGAGSGTVALKLEDNDTIRDTVGNPLGGTGSGNGNFTSGAYEVDRTAAISGSISYPDLSGITVALLNNQSIDEITSANSLEIAAHTAASEPEGIYSFDSVPYGEYLLVAYRDADGSGSLDFENNEPIEPFGGYRDETETPQPLLVNQQSLSGLEITLETYATVTGRVIYQDQQLPDLSGIKIALFNPIDPSTVTSFEQLILFREGTVNASGDFRFTRLNYNSFTIGAYYDKNNNDQLDFGPYGPTEPFCLELLTVDADIISGIQLELTLPTATTVSGSITSPDGNLSDITVVLAEYPDVPPSSIDDINAVADTVVNSSPESEGTYQFADIPFGQYILYAYRDDIDDAVFTFIPEIDGDPVEPFAIYGYSGDEMEPLPLIVAEEIVTIPELTLTIPPLATVSGQLQHADYTNVTLALLGNQSLDGVISFEDLDIRYQTSEFGVNPEESGSYTLDNVLYGDYLLVAYDDLDEDGELDFINNNPAEPVGTLGGTESPQTLVVDQPSLTGLNFSIESFGDISGQVVYDELGDLSVIEIGLFFADDPTNITSSGQLELRYSGTVDSSGSFTIDNALYGDYVLVAYYDKYKNGQLDFGAEGPIEPCYFQSITVDTAPTPYIEAPLSVQTATSVSGFVDVQDDNLANTIVVLADLPTAKTDSITDLTVVEEITVNTDTGAYHFSDIPYGQYFLYTYRDEDGDGLDIVDGQPIEPVGIYGVTGENSDPVPLVVDSSDITANLILFTDFSTGSVTGQVYYTDMSHIHVLLLKNDSLTGVQAYEDLIIADETIANEETGDYAFYNVPAGFYLVLAFRNEFINDELDFYYDGVDDGIAEPYGVSGQIEVGEAEVPVPQIDLTPVDLSGEMAAIAGLVTADNLENVKVFLSANSPDEIDTIDSFGDITIVGDQVPVDPENGSYILTDIPYGQYFLFAYQDINLNNNELDFVDGEIVEPVVLYADFNGPTLLTVLEPSLANINIYMQSMYGTVSGQITTQIANPSIEVALLNRQDLNFSSIEEMEITHQVSADASGNYQFTDVDYGQYLLIAFHDQYDDGVLNFADGSPSEPMAAYGGNPPSTLNVLSSSVSGIDFSLESPASVHGATVFVMGEEGSIIPGATVTAFTDDGVYVGEAETNSLIGGGAMINNLAEDGEYYFEISHPDYFPTLTPLYTVSAEMVEPYSDTILVETLLFSNESITGIFGLSSIDDTGYVLSIIIADQDGNGNISEEENLDLESVNIDGEGTIGYMPTDSQTLNYEMTSFESPVYILDGATQVYMAGAKDVPPSTYWMGIDPEPVDPEDGDSRGNYAKVEANKLTVIFVTPPPIDKQME